MKKLLLASSCALALGAMSTSAYAQGWAASADGGYANASCCGGSLDGFTINGAMMFPLSWSSLGVELNGGDHGLGPFHDFDAGGSLIWSGPDFRLAGTAVYNRFGTHGADVSETQLGGGLEWYFNPWLTGSAQGGGIVGDNSGGYVGGTLKGYLMPDLSLSGNILYTSIAGGHETDYGVKAEWLVLPTTLPLSVYGGYTRADLSGGPNFDVFTVGLKLYLDGMGPAPLVERNRTGTLDTIGVVHPAITF
jgi:hypothetical protein